MKPWPEALAKLCPLDPRITNPERPWWRLVATECGVSTYCRVDEKMAYAPSPRNLMPTAEVDAAYPLPHPGFRAGQVWADETGTTVVVTRMTQGIPWFENGRGSGYIEDYPYLVADPCCPHLAPWAPPEGS